MATNLMKSYIDWQVPDHPKANWAKPFRNITSGDVGYGIPIFCDEIIANSNVSLDIRAAMFTNPTKAPLYSRFKQQITAWWCPVSCYVPALRDGAKFNAQTDYSFPTINFNYSAIKTNYNEAVSALNVIQGGADSNPLSTEGIEYILQVTTGHNQPCIPTASIWSYLRMWPNEFSPLQFIGGNSFPQAKNAIPLLMYYDILRNYIINNQDTTTYIRRSSFKPTIAGYSPGRNPIDGSITREGLDNVFKNIRDRGNNYPMDDGWNISDLMPIVFPTRYVQYSTEFNKVGQIHDLVESSVYVPDYHCGLWRDTYLNDFYTAYISTENVEYERSSTNIVVEANDSLTGSPLTFNMDEIRMGSMIQNFVRTHIFSNNSFDDYVDTEYGCKPNRNLTKPLFLGAVSSYLAFNDVIAQAQTGDSGEILDNEALGSRTAVGQGHIMTGKYRGKNKRGKYDRSFVKFHAPEPGYLMLILTLKPEVAYFEGYDAMYDKHSIFDLYRPTFQQIGYQDKCKRHAYIMPSLEYDPTGKKTMFIVDSRGDIQPRPDAWEAFDTAYAYEPYGFEYMGKPNIITGQMTEIGTYRHWTNARVFGDSYDKSDGGVTRDNMFSTTILPEMYHYIFANTQNLDNFQFFFDFDYNVYQSVPHKILSFK